MPQTIANESIAAITIHTADGRDIKVQGDKIEAVLLRKDMKECPNYRRESHPQDDHKEKEDSPACIKIDGKWYCNH